MKKYINISVFILPLILFVFAFLVPSSVSAQTTDPFDAACNRLETTQEGLSDAEKEEAQSSVCADDKNSDPTAKGGIFTKVISFLSWGIGVLSVMIIIYGSIKYVLSGGESSKVTVAKETILYAFIGLVIAVMAEGIIVFVLSKA